jgi:hypothetical protein
MKQLDQNLDMLTKFAAKHEKIAALTECGLKNLTEADWWTEALMPIVHKYPVSYLLVWRNYEKEWFGPAAGKPDAPYFVKYYNDDKSLFLKDIQ